MTNNQPLTKYQQALIDAAVRWAQANEACSFWKAKTGSLLHEKLQEAEATFRALVARAVEDEQYIAVITQIRNAYPEFIIEVPID